MLKLVAGLLACVTLVVGCKKRTYNSTQASKDQNVTLTAESNFGDQSKFFFGLATAPAHVEDKLNDTWLDFARKGKVAAFSNQSIPEERLRFWTNPDEEINLAAATGVKVFRMGIDWGRLQPGRPGSKECDGNTCPDGIQDRVALARYKEIVKKVRSKGMVVMMTLFHHSLPNWALPLGGWTNSDMSRYFFNYSKDVIKEFDADVAHWITFNEPAVFAVLTYVAGIWPPGIADVSGLAKAPGVYEGAFHTAVRNMTDSHKKIYTYVKQTITNKATSVGIAHNVGRHIASSFLDLPSVLLTRELFNYLFSDLITEHLDFLGLNYYGAELVSGSGVNIEDGVEYSDSGRAVDPFGMYEILKTFHERYNVNFEKRSEKDKAAKRIIPFVITENGISDASDIIRPAYLVEHLTAIKKAMDEGVPVKGYVFWTISDNWEWADGYCPKFGLVSVERHNGLRRVPRESYNLFSDIVRTGKVTKGMRENAWKLVQSNVGKPRDFCRAADGKSSLDEPIKRLIVAGDWRFTGQAAPFLQSRFKTSLSELELPEWVKDKSSNAGQFIETLFNTLKQAGEIRLSVESKHDGNQAVAVHLPPGNKMICRDGPDTLTQANLVFENTFYFKSGKFVDNSRAYTFKIDGLKGYIGAPGRNDFLAGFLPRVNFQDIKIDAKEYTISDPGIPLMKVTRKIDWSSFPDITCRLVPEIKFGNGFKSTN